jgi:hypothetical protein
VIEILRDEQNGSGGNLVAGDLKIRLGTLDDAVNKRRNAKNTKLNFTERELNHLKKLSKYTTWKGRYHIPKNSEGIDMLIQPGTGDRFTSEDTKIVEELIALIKLKIRK